MKDLKKIELAFTQSDKSSENYLHTVKGRRKATNGVDKIRLFGLKKI